MASIVHHLNILVLSDPLIDHYVSFKHHAKILQHSQRRAVQWLRHWPRQKIGDRATSRQEWRSIQGQQVVTNNTAKCVTMSNEQPQPRFQAI